MFTLIDRLSHKSIKRIHIESEQAQSLDKYAIQIRDYIITNPGKNEEEISKYMHHNGVCSRITTRKKIDILQEKGIIEDRKDKQNSFHSYYYNDKNAFGILYKELSEIETIMDRMTRNMRIINESEKMGEMKKKSDPLSILIEHLVLPYVKSINIILRLSLLRTSDSIPSQTDSQILYSKITKLMLKINRQIPMFSLREQSILIESSEILERLRRSRLVQDYAKDKNIKLDIVDDLVSKIEDFSKRPLSLTIVK